MVSKTLKGWIEFRIKKGNHCVFMLRDFSDLSDKDQVARVIKTLVEQKLLIKIGYGVYAKTKRSSVTGNIMPAKPLPDLAREFLKMINIETFPSKLEKRYNDGKANQVPTGRVIGVKRRVTRRIGYQGKYITFEKIDN